MRAASAASAFLGSIKRSTTFMNRPASAPAEGTVGDTCESTHHHLQKRLTALTREATNSCRSTRHVQSGNPHRYKHSLYLDGVVNSAAVFGERARQLVSPITSAPFGGAKRNRSGASFGLRSTLPNLTLLR